jgi:hypothetical protein
VIHLDNRLWGGRPGMLAAAVLAMEPLPYQGSFQFTEIFSSAKGTAEAVKACCNRRSSAQAVKRRQSPVTIVFDSTVPSSSKPNSAVS